MSNRLIAFFIIGTILLAGCINSQQPAKKPGLETLRISYVKLPLNVPSIVEKKLQLVEKEFASDHISVGFQEITEGPKMTEAIAANSLDICSALGSTSAILAAANGVDLTIVGVYSRAPKAFTIMAVDPSIQSVRDLKGLKVAGPKGTILHQLLLAALEKEGLSGEQVDYINMGIPQSLTALQAGHVQAALVAGPPVPRALESGARILTTGEGLLDATIVIAARSKLLEEYPDVIRRYMKVRQESLAFMEKERETAYQMVSDDTQISLEDVKKMYQWYDFNPHITDKDVADLEKTQNFLLKNGLLDKKIDIRKIIRDMSQS